MTAVDLGPKRPLAPTLLPFMAAAGPLWPTWVGVQQLQVGRVVFLVVLLAATFDVVSGRARPLRPAWSALAVGGGLLALAGWNALSAYTWGCTCSGSAQGVTSTALLFGIAAFVMLYATPRQAAITLGVAAAVTVAAGALAVVGIRDLHAEVFAPSAGSGRLQGVYGNPNSLGFALALSIPVGLAALGTGRVRWRVVAGVVTLTASVMLLATFSRASLISAGIGGAGVLLVGIPFLRRPRVIIATAVVVPILLVALIASPIYRDQRVQANFGGKQRAAEVLPWTPGAVVAIDVPGAKLSNPSGTSGLLVQTTKPLQGVTHRLGNLFDAGRWRWELDLSVPVGAPRTGVDWQVIRADGTALATGRMTAQKNASPYRARFDVTTRGGDYLLLQLWTRRPTEFRIDRLVTSGQPPRPTLLRTVSTRLDGNDQARLHEIEDRFIDSRTTGLRLAWRAFEAQPLRGIGSNRFPQYAKENANFGLLATHNTYTQVGSELGLVGLLFLSIAGAAAIAALVRMKVGRAMHAAVIGTTLAAMVNLAFINALTAPGTLMPLAIAVAIATGWAGRAPVWRPGRLERVSGPPTDLAPVDPSDAEPASTGLTAN